LLATMTNKVFRDTIPRLPTLDASPTSCAASLITIAQSRALAAVKQSMLDLSWPEPPPTPHGVNLVDGKKSMLERGWPEPSPTSPYGTNLLGGKLHRSQLARAGEVLERRTV
jgi:hypothetical protein